MLVTEGYFKVSILFCANLDFVATHITLVMHLQQGAQKCVVTFFHVRILSNKKLRIAIHGL